MTALSALFPDTGGGTLASKTTARSTAYTAAAGDWVMANTTSAAFTLTLPASPTVGMAVRVTDAANAFDANALTVGRNGQTIDGVAADFVMNVEGWDVLFIWSGATWVVKGLTTIKRLQRVFYSIASGSASVSVTWTAVNILKTRVELSDPGANNGNSSAQGLTISSLSSTGCTLTRVGTGGTHTGTLEIVEYW
jgi:hypothetical protein